MRVFSFRDVVERSITKTFKGPLYSKFVEAICLYHLVEPGDRIAVALSGGKDSLLLAKLFQEYRRHGNVEFEMVFLTMDPGYSPEKLEKHKETCERLGIDVAVEPSAIFKVTEEYAKEDPCFLCARMRRGVLYKLARKYGCNKLALGHHFDDVIETTLLNMFYAGTFKTMLPKIRSENYPEIELIRPMYLVKEHDIVRFMNYHKLEAMNCGCRFILTKTDSKRGEIKNLIASLRKVYMNIDINIFRSAENVNLNGVLGYRNEDDERTFLDDY
ncbi:MAG: tRNA 2-thiocytidine biosynthesis TtcA family protein [Candidatus Izemoplasmatales bacterium]